MALAKTKKRGKKKLQKKLYRGTNWPDMSEAWDAIARVKVAAEEKEEERAAKEREEKKELKRRAKEAKARAEEAKGIVDEVNEIMKVVIACEDLPRDADPKEKKTAHSKMVEGLNFILGPVFLHSRDPFMREVVACAILDFSFNQTFSDHEGVAEMFDLLYGRGLLVEVPPSPHADLPGGMIKFPGGEKPATIYGKCYNFAEPLMRKYYVNEYRLACRELRERTQKLICNLRLEIWAAMEKEAAKNPVTPEMVLMNRRETRGLLFLEIPADEVDNSKSPGAKIRRKGGSLLLECASGSLWVKKFVSEPAQGAVSSFERAVRNGLKSLKESHSRIRISEIASAVFSKKNPENIKNLDILSRMIIRGFQHHQAEVGK